MSAPTNDVAFGNDVMPLAQRANITSLRPSGATSLRAKRVTSFLRQQKHHFHHPGNQTPSNTRHFAGQWSIQKGRDFLALFVFCYKTALRYVPQSLPRFLIFLLVFISQGLD